MRNLTVPRLIFSIIFTIFIFQSLNSESNWITLQEGNKIILIRHALAPGSGDPSGFRIDDCKTQRNLNATGISQSKKIGKLFRIKKIPVDQVLSSQWCRCKDTAKNAFNNFKEFPALNSTFQAPFDKNKDKQVKQLRNFIKNWNGRGKNLILITHYSIITAISNAVPGSGELVVIDKNFNVLASIPVD